MKRISDLTQILRSTSLSLVPIYDATRPEGDRLCTITVTNLEQVLNDIANNVSLPNTSVGQEVVPPAAPNIIGHSAGSRKVRLELQQVALNNAVLIDFSVRYRTVANQNWVTLLQSPNQDYTFEVFNLTDGVQYEFQARLVTSAGNSAWGASSFITPRSIVSYNNLWAWISAQQSTYSEDPAQSGLRFVVDPISNLLDSWGNLTDTNNNVAFTSTGAARPLTNLSTLQSRNTVWFNQTTGQKFMTITKPMQAGVTAANRAYTVFCVLQTSSTAKGTIFNGSDFGHFIFGTEGVGGTGRIKFGRALSTGLGGVGTIPISDDRIHLATVVCGRQQNRNRIWVDGVLDSTFDFTGQTETYGLPGTNVFTIGRFPQLGGVEQFNGHIYELAIFDDAISEQDIKNINYEFLTRYSVGQDYYFDYNVPLVRVEINDKNPSQNDVITYSIEITNDILFNMSLDVFVEGDLTDSDFNTPFFTALQTAVNATTGVTLSGNRLTFTPSFPQPGAGNVGTLSWSRTLTKNSTVPESHVVRIEEVEFFTRSIATLPLTCCISGPIPMQPAVPFLRGLNMAGAEFGVNPESNFPQAFYNSTATIDNYLDRGFDVIRYPYKIERFQRAGINQPLTTVDFNNYKANVDYITQTKNKWVSVDPHNYAAYNGVKISRPGFKVSDLIRHWRLVASGLGNNTRIIYNLMNEPEAVTPRVWADAAKSVVYALRANKHWNMMHIPGTFYTKAAGFPTRDGMFWEGWVDPADIADPTGKRWQIEVHQYPDADESGSSGVCATSKTTSLDAITTWAEAQDIRLFLGEFGFNDNANCRTVYNAWFNNVMEKTNTPWNGWTAWAGGAFWSDTYHYRLHPLNGVDTAYMNMIEERLALPKPTML